ncbi:MAG: DUF1134 domain-containing protein [Novosphingobium sp.]|nr:DUF1134 domain-containing protein [Novosphingobium sp.]
MALSQTKPFRTIALAVLAAFALGAAPAAAQIQSVDPDAAIDGDLMGEESPPADFPVDAPAGAADAPPQPSIGNGTPVESTAPADSGTTYHKDDLIGAAEGVFGKGAEGLAEMIEDLLKKQGEPNGYIVGREGGGAFMVGLRYGSGTLYHKVEGKQSTYWTGPSLGIDIGANAGNAFILVYNLFDTADLYHRYGAGEGQAYLIGGFHVSYLRRGDVVLIPVRMGAGLRLGANIGYMKFSHKQKWQPF